MFTIEQTYTKKQIYELLKVPIERRKGSWDTGYREYNGDYYIFANIGIPGRTGHNYANYWDGDLLHWEAKANTHIAMPSIRKLLNRELNQRVFVFTRTNDMDPFTYEGIGKVCEYVDQVPVKIIWQFDSEVNFINQAPLDPEQVLAGAYWEGGTTQILVNKYERDRSARRECVKHYGATCQVCEFDFEKQYGKLGKDFIHVHHIVSLSTINKEYKVNPITDLIPVCPNCHCMIHKRIPAFTVYDLKELRRK